MNERISVVSVPGIALPLVLTLPSKTWSILDGLIHMPPLHSVTSHLISSILLQRLAISKSLT